jgi:hypothetical protein
VIIYLREAGKTGRGGREVVATPRDASRDTLLNETAYKHRFLRRHSEV